MFYCKKCNAEFDELKLHYERHGFSEPPYEERFCCPCCESENVLEIRQSAETLAEEYEDLLRENFTEDERVVLGIENSNVTNYQAAKDAKYWRERYNYLIYKLKNFIGGENETK